MKCPACSSRLETVRAGVVDVDVCNSSCGGVWFDKEELERLDEDHEYAPLSVLRPVSYQNVALDREKKRACPRCPKTGLDRHFFDANYLLELDSCPTCNGIWLDLGELQTLRENNRTAAQRNATIESFMKACHDPAKPHAIPDRLRAVFRLIF